jgi:hypothetical protein
MKVLIIGNVAAGKSTLIAWFKNHIDHPVVSIDGLRSQFGDGTIAGEYLALHHFLKRCASRNSMYVEFSGGGAHKHAVMLALKESTMPVHVILVDTPLATCLKRIEGKKWLTPYPKWDVPTEDVLPRLMAELEADAAKGFWAAGGLFSSTRLRGDDKDALNSLLRTIQDGE